jgi:ATP-dependent DNA helicase PIF1
LAWALTIHKCQGATISNVITDLRGVFEEAQVYVTLSRACSLDGLFIIGINYGKIKCNTKVKKYYESLTY